MRVAGLLLALGVLAWRVDAQPTDSGRADPRPAATIARPRAGALEVWGGMGGRSPQWGLLGETPHMRFAQFAIRWSRALGTPPSADELPATEWTIDLIPVARLSPPLVSLRDTGTPCPHASLCVLPPDPADLSGLFPPGAPLGVGIAPLGLTHRFLRSRRVSPWIGVTGGALHFAERVPTTKAARFNFTASAELGLRFGGPAERGLTLAYRFHHISNAGTAGENPGVASHLVTVGIHHPRRAARPHGG